MLVKVSESKDPPDEKSKPKNLPPVINFLNGGLSGMAATCVVHPMDVIKNRMQMSEEGALIGQTVKSVFQSGGIGKFYAGLSASLLRQATYTTTRLGIYNQLNDIWRDRYSKNPGIGILVIMAAIAGSSGAFVGTPADVALVRMTSDGRLSPEKRKNYKNVIDAFVRMIREEGTRTLWRGSTATIGRAAVVNVSQLASYSQAKYLLSTKLDIPDGISLHFSASMLSGIITAFNSMPFDIAKTRIQNLSGKEEAPNMLRIMAMIAKNEGFLSLWRGFWPTYCRVGPHTVITFIVNEQFAEAYRQTFMK